ncbi:MAG: hypothetical protein JWO13_2644 [Acidobacteriales bacterium]|nr:hypothetical protein [Terriglobales bacterium]
MQDRISSAANVLELGSIDKDEPYTDPHYGHTWSYVPRLGSAVYGMTGNFASSPIDHFAKGVFLRVPFRRIPVMEVGSIEELFSFAGRIHSPDPTIKVMWRGQTQEYLMSRSAEQSKRLFGEAQVMEPSLLPSASRASVDFSSVFASWCAVLDAYLMDKSQMFSSSSSDDSSLNELRSFQASYNYRLWALATAQHYGLPSIGLDVTPNLDVAILFALYSFTVDRNTGKTAMRRLEEEESPVVYAMSAFENDLLDDATISSPFLQCARPKAQSAHFLCTSWGLAPNKAAERIFVAIRLKNHRNWRLPKDVRDLFPSSRIDEFVAFLLEIRSKWPKVSEDGLLNRVYYMD